MKILNKPILILSVMLFVSSCWQKYWFDTFEVVNDSGHDVLIRAYLKVSDQLDISDSLRISAGNTYSIRKDYGESHDPKGVFTISRPDSVIISFDDGRCIPQVCGDNMAFCMTEKNLMDYHEYYKVTELDDKKDGRYVYTYTITKEDYDSSEPN